MRIRFLSFIVVLIFSTLFIAVENSSATEGACSYHGGANCDIGPVNNRTVCNDNWLSSVLYSDMEECIGHGSLCQKYLYAEQYSLKKTELKNKLTTLKAEVDKLQSELNSLDYEEQQAVLEYYKSIEGRGVTAGGAQPHINAIHNEYALKKINASSLLDETISQYNNLVNEYNGICRNYSDTEKNDICVQNYSNQYKFSNGLCVELPPKIITCTSWTYSNWTNCIGGEQKRNIVVALPANCTGGNPTIIQSCQSLINLEGINEKNIEDKSIFDNNLFESEKNNTIDEEKKLLSKIDNILTNKLKGKILLQVENNGEGWYINPDNEKKYFLGRPSDAFDIMRNLGLGIKHNELTGYLNSQFPKKLSGKILLDVEKNGEAYYINPEDLKGYYLNRPSDAFKVMRELGLGITNNDIRKIDIGEI